MILIPRDTEATEHIEDDGWQQSHKQKTVSQHLKELWTMGNAGYFNKFLIYSGTPWTYCEYNIMHKLRFLSSKYSPEYWDY